MRQSDYATGSIGRVVQLLVLVLVIAGAVWVHVHARDLREFSDRREAELIQFVNLSHTARRVPARDLDRVAKELDRQLETQQWYTNVDSARPSVVVRSTGLTVRFRAIVPASDPRQVQERDR